MEIAPDFKEFTRLLNENNVKYLVVGGYAVNLYGYPRYTKDIDFWVWISEENAENLEKTLKDFGFGSLGFIRGDFLDPENVVHIGREPNRIDIIMELRGLDFEECFERKRIVEAAEGHFINFISLDDLLIAKKLAGRYQDLADAEKLEKIRNQKKRK